MTLHCVHNIDATPDVLWSPKQGTTELRREEVLESCWVLGFAVGGDFVFLSFSRLCDGLQGGVKPGR
ncbi:hypothetical protein GUJ93_ZPchr0013g36399 [Zizania palustris]|uniref:Uncharacterized protein n=1 Tax=Zizania palustris TaxID=103762 RepID=A0A8J5WX46_ZIZPA|nr:hypothetical protein GUJ93_ZPchr0013g36399 [Zizania palustris]